jgi:hypothetical protein
VFQETGGKSLRCGHCHQTFVDMKSLQIHIFVDHQNIKGSPMPPNKVAAPPPQAAPPLAPPAHALLRPVAVVRAPDPQPAAPVNGYHYAAPSGEAFFRRQTSSSSELSDTPSPSAAATFSCDLCGLAGIPDRASFKQASLHGTHFNE